MSDTYYLIGILIMAAVTVLLRVLPFIALGGKRKVPGYITRLSSRLPYAVMVMLIIHCLRNISFSKAGTFLPECICIIIVILLHLWRHNTILSIVSGTVIYMLLVQVVF